jgi:hypothetical protein
MAGHSHWAGIKHRKGRADEQRSKIFSKISKEISSDKSEFLLEGGVSYSDYDDIQNAISIFDLNRSISHIPKIQVIKGDVTETIPKFIDDHPEIVVSLLNIDMDLYEPQSQDDHQ